MSPFSRTRAARSPTKLSRGTLKEHLAVATEFARIAEQAERLRTLQTILDTTLPVHLLPGTHVANLKRGKIVIHAASGAVAVKLRQLAPRLTDSFIQQGQQVTGIEVRVQAGRSHLVTSRPKIQRQLGNQPKQALTSLADGLDEASPLAKALRKLLRNT